MTSPTWLYILLVVVLLALGMILVYVVLKKARRSPRPPAAAEEGGEPGQLLPAELGLYASGVELKLSFSKAMRRIRRLYGKGAQYKVPWYLMIGEAGSGKTTILGSTGLELLSEWPDEAKLGVKEGVNWFFFDQAVVLDVAGDFVLRADAEPPNVKGWNYLAKLLRRHRPERPLDGIILTIPCADLTAAANPSSESKLKIELKSAQVYQKLVAAHQTLGVNLPVYVLVTKCDGVAGFASLCHEIPARRDEIFGWSSPYTRDIAYRSEWVAEAFQSVAGYLYQIQMEVFAERDEVRDGDGLFMLPSEMRAMGAPLRVYLDRIFKESTYHDPFFLRGIYFCGDGADGVAVAPLLLNSPAAVVSNGGLPPVTPVSPTPAPAIRAGRSLAFLRHLFERKIFEEELLARPVVRVRLSRNRLARAAQVLSLAIPLVGGLGILATYPWLKGREREFYQFLVREDQDLKALRAERETGAGAGQAHNREANLFEAMAALSGKRLISPFIPGSWLSDVDRDSGVSVSNAYQHIVLESLRRGLDCRTENKLRVASPGSTCYAPVVSAGGQAGSLGRCGYEADASSGSVYTFIESLNELRLNRARYESFIRSGGGNLEELNRLLLYFNHAPLPADFDPHNSLYAQALRTSQRPALLTTDDNLRAMAVCKVEGMIGEIYDQTFKNKTVTYGYLGEIGKTENLLSRPGNEWLANSRFQLPSPLAPMTFTEGLAELKRALTDLSKEKFMSRGFGTMPPPAEPPAGDEPEFAHQSPTVLVWDTAALQQAIDLATAYGDFVANNSYNRPDTLDVRVKEAARNDVTRKIRQLVRRAQVRQTARPLPGESMRGASLRGGVKSLQDAQDHIVKLLNLGRALRIDVGLRGAVVNQSISLLREVGDEFGAGNFYVMVRPDFSWWRLGAPVLSYRAFGVNSPDELSVYLSVQRGRIATLARQYAAPLINFLAQLDVALGPEATEWNRILDQLNKYDAKQAGSTVSALEEFIRVEMDNAGVDDCDLINNALPASDYFTGKRKSLAQPLRGRCLQLRQERQALRERRDDDFQLTVLENERLAREQRENDFYAQLERYHALEDSFNDTLADKFPFSALPETDTFAEADPDSLIAFFRLLDKNKEEARSVLRKCERDAAGSVPNQCPNPRLNPQDALLFLDRMEAAQKFFASFLEKKPPYPTYDFNLRFRVNEPRAVGSNQIIDWAFAVGKKRIRYQDVSTVGSWGYTEPLTVWLRWANDSPTIPDTTVPPLWRTRITEKTVTVSYDNKWSLLLLLLRHKAGTNDFEQRADLEPNTLKFTVPTKTNGALPDDVLKRQPKLLLTSAADVFMRVSVMAPGEKVPLTLPDLFPRQAPPLPRRNPSTRKRRVQE
jgi:hypothetical protein